MSTYKLIIEVSTSEKAANYLKEQIEEHFPLLDGKVQIHKEPEIQMLNELIEEMKKEKENDGWKQYYEGSGGE